jgi:hypothetical protein
MKKQHKLFSLLIVFFSALVLSSCYTEDPGPLQDHEKEYSITDFDRVEMGSALNVEVRQGEFFQVSAKGDSRNIDDLRVRKQGSTLVIDYDDSHNRKHETYIYITMPSLRAANFSGASDSRVSGFSEQDIFDFNLSGASTSQVDAEANEINVRVSGASNLRLTGIANRLDVEVSGASELSAFNLTAEEARVKVSGASEAKVNVSTDLHATASGASSILYRGEPNVTKDVSGASSVTKD